MLLFCQLKLMKHYFIMVVTAVINTDLLLYRIVRELTVMQVEREKASYGPAPLEALLTEITWKYPQSSLWLLWEYSISWMQ